MSHHRYAVAANAKPVGWTAARIALCLSLLAPLFALTSFQAHAQKLSDKWAPLSPAEFETYRSVFAAYDIETHRNDIVVLGVASLKIFRIESQEFCNGTLCLTILVSICGKLVCPSTSIFVKRDIEFVRVIAGFFGGTQFLEFRLSKDRHITVMLTKRFISVSRGLGEE